MAIYVTGDTHGATHCGSHYDVNGFLHRFNTQNFPEQKEMTKDDFVIICGDFGGVWNFRGETNDEKYNLDWLENKPFTTLFVPGNHENYDRLTGINDESVLDTWLFDNVSDEVKEKIKTGYPQKQWHGGLVREIRPSVLMLERGHVFNIDGQKCFAFGGARSHDIAGGILKYEECADKNAGREAYKKFNKRGFSFRENHVTWWEQEMPEQMEMEFGWAMLEDEKYKVDFIFTHDSPSSDKIMLHAGRPDELNLYFEEVKNKVEYKKWFFGHMHDNIVLPGNKDILLYEQIIRIY